MVDQGPARKLITWAIATFHTTFLTAATTVSLHLAGELGSGLTLLNTYIGAGLFVALWGATWWCTGKMLQEIEWRLVAGGGFPLGKALRAGFGWGALHGLVFLAVLAIGGGTVAGILSVAEGDLSGWSFPIIGAFSLPFGSIIALPVGAVIGVVFAIIDSLLLLVIRRYDVAAAPIGDVLKK